MKGPQPLGIEVVVTAVLRAVGQKGAVGADTGRHQRALTAGAVCRQCPELVARSMRQLYRAAQQPLGLRLAEPATDESRDAGLIAGRDDAVGPGFEVVEVQPADRLRLLEQQPGRPERVVEVVAAGLELGGQPAVEDHHLLARQQVAQWVGQPSPPFSPIVYSNAAST